MTAKNVSRMVKRLQVFKNDCIELLNICER